MYMQKRIAALLITLALSMGLPGPALASKAEAYEICTVEDLLAFAGRVNGGEDLNAILMEDLDLSQTAWTPMNGKPYTTREYVAQTGYEGTFDGNGHTISGIKLVSDRQVSMGSLFSTLGAGGVIKNLTLSGLSIKFGVAGGYSTNVGGLANRVYGRISNCTVSGKITGDDAFVLGGIAAYLETGGVVEDCVSDVYISVRVTEQGIINSGYTNVGGIVGDSNGLINRCVNNGNIRVDGPVHGCNNVIGGIVAYSFSLSYGTLLNCKNTGSITVTGYGDAENDCVVGGVVGDALGIPVNSCNTGDIYVAVIGSGAIVGGIAGDSAALYNCWSSGEVSGQCDNGRLTGTMGAAYSGTKSEGLYYLAGSAPDKGAGTEASAAEFSDGTLTAKLNEYVLNNPGMGLLTWTQTAEGPAFGGQALWAETLTAAPTASTVLVNGKAKTFDAYNINGSNFFKLRDLAYVLSGTEKQFAVEWDAAGNAIRLISGKGYTPAGGELSAGSGGAKTAEATTSAIYLDGKKLELTAYSIGGNNYFKLRDVGEALDFSVVWDGVSNSIFIDTSKGYSAD